MTEDISRLKRDYLKILANCDELQLTTLERRVEAGIFKRQAKLEVIHSLKRALREKAGILEGKECPCTNENI